ncbi:NfeD family protein [Vibrio salinus]|uniref:NfeD family protein n=1 Tax=Vibrio salinus TaxID=2899784 RepID=UPI001E32ADA1|nr:NfeD family protein [Vibrio salinus]MCE0493001.1 NfeD family protein [Vibrio salinus]
MAELVEQINFIHWLSLGLVLLTLELINTGGYFLWLGFSALSIGILLCIHDVSWDIQWQAFAGFSILTCWLWLRNNLYHRPVKKSDFPHPYAEQLIGRTFRLDEIVLEGDFSMQIGQVNWLATTKTPIIAGSIVTISDYDGFRLVVRKK